MFKPPIQSSNFRLHRKHGEMKLNVLRFPNTFLTEYFSKIFRFGLEGLDPWTPQYGTDRPLGGGELPPPSLPTTGAGLYWAPVLNEKF